MEKKTMPGISQCMIVKNEERNIERALSWGKGIVSEQIVVDTGSADRTMEMARSMGAKVYEFPWTNDFSAAKNYAISNARYEWIVFLDADEYFLMEDAQKLPALLNRFSNKGYDGVKTMFVDLDDEGKVMDMRSHLRIFRNLHELRYHRRIHENLKKYGDKAPYVADLTGELTIYHTGYGETEIKRKHGDQRNLNMILAELAEHPGDYEMYGYLGNEYEGLGELEQAESSYQKAVSLMPKEMRGRYGVTSSEIWRRFLNVLTLIPGKTESQLLEVYHQAREGWPEDGDYDYVMGQYYGSHGSYQAGERHLRQALDLLEHFGCGDKSARLSGNILKAYEMLAMCCFNNGNLEECVRITAMMLKQNPYLMSVLMIMLSALLKDPGTGGKGQAGAVETVTFLGNNFYRLESLKDRLFILRAALSAGYGEVVGVLKETFTPEEFNAVDQALEGKLSRRDIQKSSVQLIPVPTSPSVNKERDRLHIVLFYCSVDSFNFFVLPFSRSFFNSSYSSSVSRSPEIKSETSHFASPS